MGKTKQLTEKDDPKELDFVNRCHQLDTFLGVLRSSEPSDRVWCAVFTGDLVDIALRQKDPQQAFATIIRGMKIHFDGVFLEKKEHEKQQQQQKEKSEANNQNP